MKVEMDDLESIDRRAPICGGGPSRCHGTRLRLEFADDITIRSLGATHQFDSQQQAFVLQLAAFADLSSSRSYDSLELIANHTAKRIAKFVSIGLPKSTIRVDAFLNLERSGRVSPPNIFWRTAWKHLAASSARQQQEKSSFTALRIPLHTGKLQMR